MNWKIDILLIAAGIMGGLVNALAGGATLITFPAMLAAGLPPVIANASNAVAICPGHLIAALADRERLPRIDPQFVMHCTAALVGGGIGAYLLLILPERYFILPVPALIAFATVLFAAAPRIQTRVAPRRTRTDRSPLRLPGTAMVGAASVYGGFFGAGLGVMLTAVLSIDDPGDLRAVKVFKNLLATIVSLTAVTIFCVQHLVRWPETLVMLTGAIMGGYAGGHLIRVLPPETVRRIVILAGISMTIIYAHRYWW